MSDWKDNFAASKFWNHNLAEKLSPFSSQSDVFKAIPKVFSGSDRIKFFQGDFGAFCNLNISRIDWFLILCHLQIQHYGSIKWPKRPTYGLSYKYLFPVKSAEPLGEGVTRRLDVYNLSPNHGSCNVIQGGE